MSALGALMLLVGVFLPWYGVSLTPAGLSALSGHVAGPVAALLGDAGHGARAASGHGARAAGPRLGTLSAREALSVLSAIMLAAACLALLDAALGVAHGAMSVPDGAGQAVVPLGVLASACVCYRMAVPPALGTGLAVSLQAGAWLSLLGGLMIALGGMWPRTLPAIHPPEPGGAGVGSALGRLG